MWLCSTDDYVNILILNESPPLTQIHIEMILYE